MRLLGSRQVWPAPGQVHRTVPNVPVVRGDLPIDTSIDQEHGRWILDSDAILDLRKKNFGLGIQVGTRLRFGFFRVPFI